MGKLLEIYEPIPTGQERAIENWHTYKLLGGVNPEYATVQAQVLKS